MKKIIHKALNILLILCFGFSALLYLYYDIAQFRDKKQAQHELKSREKLEVIQLSLEEFKQLNGADELWQNGELYDISNFTIKDGFVSVTVFHDCNEESLIHSIAESFEPNDRITADNLVHMTRHHIHPPTDGKILSYYNFEFLGCETTAVPTFYYLHSSYSFQLASILKPPPDSGLFS